MLQPQLEDQDLSLQTRKHSAGWPWLGVLSVSLWVFMMLESKENASRGFALSKMSHLTSEERLMWRHGWLVVGVGLLLFWIAENADRLKKRSYTSLLVSACWVGGAVLTPVGVAWVCFPGPFLRLLQKLTIL